MNDTPPAAPADASAPRSMRTSALVVTVSGTRPTSATLASEAAIAAEREIFLEALARRRAEGTLRLDPVSIADAILRRERS